MFGRKLNVVTGCCRPKVAVHTNFAKILANYAVLDIPSRLQLALARPQNRDSLISSLSTPRFLRTHFKFQLTGSCLIKII